MMRNSKVLISELNDEQFNVVKELGFVYGGLMRKELTKDDVILSKNYSCCGGSFELYIELSYTKRIVIHTPYNRWWCDNWKISEFTKNMESFQKQLKSDIQKLRKVGVLS